MKKVINSRCSRGPLCWGGLYTRTSDFGYSRSTVTIVNDYSVPFIFQDSPLWLKFHCVWVGECCLCNFWCFPFTEVFLVIFLQHRSTLEKKVHTFTWQFANTRQACGKHLPLGHQVHDLSAMLPHWERWVPRARLGKMGAFPVITVGDTLLAQGWGQRGV